MGKLTRQSSRQGSRRLTSSKVPTSDSTKDSRAQATTTFCCCRCCRCCDRLDCCDCSDCVHWCTCPEYCICCSCDFCDTCGVPASHFKQLAIMLAIAIAVSVGYYLIFYDVRVEDGRNSADHSVNISGVNLKPSYYNGGVVTMGWDTMKKHTQIKSVRIGIEPEMVDEGREWIRQANAQGYHTVVAYHKYNKLGSDNALDLLTAAQWWQTNYEYLSEMGLFDVNLMDKWGSHGITPEAFASAYNDAIDVVRTVYSGPVVVDIPGWGQETDTAVSASPLITDQNIVYSAHIYPQAYNQVAGRYVTPGDVKNLIEQSGRPCMLGEFGDIQSDPVGSGACDVKAVVEAAKVAGFKSVYGWAWNGDGGSLNMVTPSWTLNPTADSYTETDYFWTILDAL